MPDQAPQPSVRGDRRILRPRWVSSAARAAAALAPLFVLAACTLGSPFPLCSDFNRAGVEFTLAIEGDTEEMPHETLVVDAGGSLFLEVTRTITGTTGEDRDRTRNLDCAPRYRAEPATGLDLEATAGGLEIATETGARGIVRVSARVGGDGPPLEDHVWVVVRPPGNESALDNDSPAFATDLTLSEFSRDTVPTDAAVVGLAAGDDVDWYQATIPVGHTYFISLRSELVLPDDSTFTPPDFSASGLYLIRRSLGALAAQVVNEDDLEPIPNGLNAARVNLTEDELDLFVKIAQSGTEVPYRLAGASSGTIPLDNDPPVARDDAFAIEVDPDDPAAPVKLDILGNDTDDGIEGVDPASVVLTRKPLNGEVVLGEGHEVLYTPDADFAGEDLFFYTVDDFDRATSNEAAVRVTVSRRNRAPVARDDAAATDSASAVEIRVLDNDEDLDGFLRRATIAITSAPLNTPLAPTVDPDTGIVTYTPAAGFVGVDAFRYTVEDDDGAVSNEAVVVVTVTAP